MPDNKTISELPEIQTLLDSDVFLLNQNGLTCNTTAQAIAQHAKSNFADTFIKLPDTAIDGQIIGCVANGQWSAISVNESQGSANDGPVRFLADQAIDDGAAAYVVTKNNQLWGLGEVYRNITANMNGTPDMPGIARFYDDYNQDYFLNNPDITIEKVIGCFAPSMMALLSDGTVWVNGYCGYKLGVGYTAANDPEKRLYGFKQVKFADNAVIKYIAMYPGSDTAESFAAISTSNNVYLWGYNGTGHLGTGDTTTVYVPTKVTIPGIENSASAVHIVGNYTETLTTIIISTYGYVWMCGGNGSGQQGIGTNSNTTTFVRAKINSTTYLSNVTSICPSLYRGRYNVFCIKTNGTVWGAGNNDGYQLGDNTTNASTYFKQIPGLTNVTKMKCASGYYSYNGTQICLTSTGKVYTWGYNDYGQCGNGSTDYVTTPYEACSSGATDIFTTTFFYNYSATAYLKDKHAYVTGYYACTKPGPLTVPIQTSFYPIHLNNVVSVIMLPRTYTDMSYGCALLLCEDGHLYGTGSNVTLIMGADGTDRSSAIKLLL